MVVRSMKQAIANLIKEYEASLREKPENLGAHLQGANLQGTILEGKDITEITKVRD
ncbi:hypothetical protein Xen7305DRAFT_00040650 [Xenococcus sp. PCC 7305]|uniref:hypothetical protein n=1 Tax=Xenococcus sp. PCC 7305 TaxID=102125 RepID=UPI0002ABFDEB|nr:hypothetical protein [Xenococcus sp. PCC 7305]ELS04335.1 hypothetical protein Xen7305DRAFT_00040650 [Xenococcus sp. PCC 7305]